jgi:hypothetical protein
MNFQTNNLKPDDILLEFTEYATSKKVAYFGDDWYFMLEEFTPTSFYWIAIFKQRTINSSYDLGSLLPNEDACILACKNCLILNYGNDT